MSAPHANLLADPPSSALQNASVKRTAPAARSACFHCGQPVPAGQALAEEMAGQRRVFCCGGCQTLARTLHSAGFAHLYGDEARFARPIDDSARRESEPVWAAYDTPELRSQFVRPLEGGRAEITLAPESIRCAACAWLIEQHLGRLPGVESTIANVATRRVVVRWRDAEQTVSGLLAALAEIGYVAWPFEVSRSDEADRRARRSLLMRMAVAMLGMMQVMMYAWPIYTHEATIDPGMLQLMRWASLALTLPVVFYSASPIFSGARRSLRQRHLGMDVPVAIGVAAGFVASTVATVRGVGEVYFDSVTMFVAFLLAARYLELRVRQASRSGAEMLARQLPATCERLGAEGAAPERVPVARLQHGDRIRVRAGEIIPADGTIVSGASELDESMLTGESRPVHRTVGDMALAGCYNTASPLEIAVDHVGAGTRLAEIVAVLDRALAEKPRLAALADRVAGWFVATLLVLAALTGVVWALWIDPSRALLVTVAVLVVSCPCALSLATPAALAAAGAALSRRGLLLTRSHALETLAGVTDVVLDKTGTLTEGCFALTGQQTLGPKPAAQCLALAAAMEAGSEHPIGRALVSAAGSAGVDIGGASMATVRNVPGQGVEAQMQGKRFRLGRTAFVAGIRNVNGEEQIKEADTVSVPGSTQVWLGDEAGMLAVFALSDKARESTPQLLEALSRHGARCHLVSGDSAETVQWWASRFGMDHAIGAVSPEGKRDYVAKLQRKGAVVLAVGDGINDAPVLAQAQVSIAIGSGAPLAQAGADAVLTHGNVADIAHALALARQTRRVVRQNLGWAFFYNVVAIPLAATGVVTAWMAGIGMSVSSLLVVANAWRLLRAGRNGV
ncbi:heavy metal translocating P-type ATPase [Cupriavidus necator]|uniref:ATPase, E1-E2 type:Copper-translocating P-type ATPase:Heavy metal translocating P-type ATPase n=1 Tax=Cupriavidus pinatubonensis (strain JMP 134 / LMG 1197) TaxID=264198 RepID=Q46ZM6_CUPPJ|nr:heavy metal translocating P-type ATPase [Cupriavidus necator]